MFNTTFQLVNSSILISLIMRRHLFLQTSKQVENTRNKVIDCILTLYCFKSCHNATDLHLILKFYVLTPTKTFFTLAQFISWSTNVVDFLYTFPFFSTSFSLLYFTFILLPRIVSMDYYKTLSFRIWLFLF